MRSSRAPLRRRHLRALRARLSDFSGVPGGARFSSHRSGARSSEPIYRGRPQPPAWRARPLGSNFAGATLKDVKLSRRQIGTRLRGPTCRGGLRGGSRRTGSYERQIIRGQPEERIIGSDRVRPIPARFCGSGVNAADCDAPSSRKRHELVSAWKPTSRGRVTRPLAQGGPAAGGYSMRGPDVS